MEKMYRDGWKNKEQVYQALFGKLSKVVQSRESLKYN